MNMKKLSRRSILGIVALALSISSVAALSLFSQTFTAVSQTNVAGLSSNCLNLVDTVTNTGISGPTETFTYQYQCANPIVNSASLGFSVVSVGNYKPTFTISTSGTVANIVSGPTLSIIPTSTYYFVQNPANTIIYGTPKLLTSGSAIALSPGEVLTGGFGSTPAEGYVYQISITVDSFGTVAIASSSISWVVA